MIIFWGPELVQLYNDAYVPILGARHPAALGQRARDCWPEIWDAIEPMLQGVLERGEATWSENLLLPLERNGVPEESYFTFSYSPIAEGDGIGGVFCAVTETTAIVLREREARERAEALAELDRAKTEFFNNVSHEFRTPLTLILGPLDERLRDGAGGDPALASDLMLMRRSARRLMRLVTALLDFNRLEAQRLTLHPVSLDPASFTADIASTFRSAIAAAGLEFAVETPPLGPALLDPRLWETVVLNLLANALKYTLAGRIELRLERVDAELRLAVRDTGVGVAQPERVFDRFWRAEGQDARSHEGSGIGLSLVREIVALHGGSVSFDSVPGRGSTVRVNVPFAEAARAVETPLPQLAELFVDEATAWTGEDEPAVPVPGGERPRILVVDDNADLRGYVARLFADRYDVALAADGATALALAQDDPPDLIVADVMMPVMDGFTLLRCLRDHPRTRDVPVLLLSARAEDGAVAAAIGAGADGYLTKPFAGRELLVNVERLLLHARRRLAETLVRERLERDLEREQRTSLAFQNAALPRGLPSIAGLRFDAVYVAAEAEALVGGDWYDAFRLADGRVVVSVGDVMGSGLDAAVTMGAVRQSIRGAAQVYPDPASVLDAADRALRSEQPDRIVTAFIAIIDPVMLTLTYASAGHPPPMMRTPDGRIEQLDDGDLPLGLRDPGSDVRPAQGIRIAPGTTIVLYTDGLTEASRNVIEGERRLAAALLEGFDDTASLRDRLAPRTSDDVAILVVTVGQADHPRWKAAKLDASAASALRASVMRALNDRDFSDGARADAELVLGELLGNVVRHTPEGEVEVVLDLAGPDPVLHVLDRGPGFTYYARLPNDPMSESGRGLFIATRLVREMSVTRRRRGGSHARAVLMRRPRAEEAVFS
jgi:signal transduction histidine kinase/DNA-binding NarL/FixJ family response regulator